MAIRQFLSAKWGKPPHSDFGYIMSYPSVLASSLQNYKLHCKRNQLLLFPLGDVDTRVLSSVSLRGTTSTNPPNNSNFKVILVGGWFVCFLTEDAWIESETGKQNRKEFISPKKGKSRTEKSYACLAVPRNNHQSLLSFSSSETGGTSFPHHSPRSGTYQLRHL